MMVQAISSGVLWVVREGSGLLLLVEAHHHEDEKRHDEDGDEDDDGGDEGMEGGDLMHDRRGGVLEADLPRRRLTFHGIGRATEQRGSARGHRHYASIENRHPITPQGLPCIVRQLPRSPLKGAPKSLDLHSGNSPYRALHASSIVRAARKIARDLASAPDVVVASGPTMQARP